MTTLDWEIFRLIEQERLSVRATAFKLNIDEKKVRDALSDMRELHPDLFPIETEKKNFQRQGGVKTQLKLHVFKPLMDSDIKRKFWPKFFDNLIV